VRARRSPASARLAVLGCVAMAALALCGSCDNSFSPKTEFAPKLSVFCVLDGTTARQMVVIEKSYDATVTLPPQPLTGKEIEQADVVITSSGGGNVRLHDTLLTLANGGTRRVWTTWALRPVSGRQYHLSVTVPGFPAAQSDVVMPSRVYVAAHIMQPDPTQSTKNAIVVSSGSPELPYPPMGVYFRLWLRGELDEGGTITVKLREVPLDFDSEGTPLFSKPSRSLEAGFAVVAAKATYDSLFAGDTLSRNRKFIVVAHAMDNAFYRYYKLVKGFDDPLSIRIDKPDVSFIDGGYGCFGAVMSDTARYDYAYFATWFATRPRR
jgi:hypothetical protein